MLLPQEILDQILLYADVRIAIALRNEYVKAILLPRLHLPLRWQSTDPQIREWLVKYNIRGRRVTAFASFTRPHYLVIDLPAIPSLSTQQRVPWTRHIGMELLSNLQDDTS